MKIKRFIFCLGKLDLKHAFKMGSIRLAWWLKEEEEEVVMSLNSPTNKKLTPNIGLKNQRGLFQLVAQDT